MHVPLVASGFLLALYSSFGQTFFIALLGLRLAGQGMMSHASVTGMAPRLRAESRQGDRDRLPRPPAGEAALPFLAVSAAAVLGWRGVWIAAAALLVLAAILLLRLIDGGRARTPPASPRPPLDVPPLPRSYTRAEMLRERHFYLILPRQAFCCDHAGARLAR